MTRPTRHHDAVSLDENTYVRDQNARVDPIFTLGTITVASLRDILADLPGDAVVVVARDAAGGDELVEQLEGRRPQVRVRARLTSLRKRARNCGSYASSGLITLMATGRPWGSRAR